MLKSLLSPIFRLLWRVEVEGRENVPCTGAVILAPNHISFCDLLFMPLSIRRRVTFVAKAEYFDSWKTAWFFRAAGQIPMRREGGSASERALATAREVLSDGGFFHVQKCQRCLHSLSREPAPPFGSYVPLGLEIARSLE